MKDFLLFRRMIMPWLIIVTFWVGSVICILAGSYCIYKHEWSMVIGVLILGPLGLRLLCEWLILVFRMNETLTDIKYLLNKREKV